MTDPVTSNIPSVVDPNARALATYNPGDDFSFLRPRDILTPRLFLMQPTSPNVIEGKFRPGELVLNDETFLAVGQKTKMIILLAWLQWIEWNPDRNAPQDQRMLNKSFDPTSQLAKEAEAFLKIKNPEGKEVVKVTEYYNCLCILPGKDNDYDRIAAFGFARSSHKEGKKILNALGTAKHNGSKCYMWEHEFEFSTKMEQKEQNRYFVPMKGTMARIPDAQYETVKKHAEAMRARREEMQARVLAQETETEAKAGVDPTSDAKAPF